MQDAVPKALMHFLVLKVQRGLQQHLIKTMYRYAQLKPWCAQPSHNELLASSLLQPNPGGRSCCIASILHLRSSSI